MTELYINIRTWNGLIAIQDLRNYFMNNVRRLTLQWVSIFATYIVKQKQKISDSIKKSLIFKI